MSVTINQVAAAAGVSIATVSRVLNGKGQVSEDARARVLAAAARLRYIPHGGARSLITRKTSTIGVLLPDIHGEFYSELIRGLDLAARQSGYHLLVSGSHGDSRDLAAVLQATRGRVDGLIVMSPEARPDTLRANLPETMPIVLVSCLAAGDCFDSIGIDNRGGARAVVKHFVSLGHRRIAMVKGPDDNCDARERLRGYRDALRSFSLRRSGKLELAGDFSEAAGYAAGQALARLSPRPTAVFAANDGMAVGVLCALREAGVRVPDDIALAGFDDIPIARFISPPLTTVRVPMSELGSRAMSRLVHSIERGTRHDRRHEVLATRLIVRGSCGAIATSRVALSRKR